MCLPQMKGSSGLGTQALKDSRTQQSWSSALEHASNAGQPGNPGRDGEVELHENDERDARVVVSHAQ